jgi:hypothetical protein
VKLAGADVNAAVEMVDRELVKLDERRKRGPGRVPDRPLEAIKRLQAASSLYARAAGVDKDLDNDAIRFDQEVEKLAVPARLPLMAGDSSTLELWSSGLALEALALDGRGLSYLRVADGKIDRERIKRTSFVRGVVRAGTTPYVVWAMPDARCDQREDRCTGRPTGIAAYNRGGNDLGEPKWTLSGHPAGRLDRALQLSELGRADLIARASADGALELLRFRLPLSEAASGSPPASGAEKKALALEPSERHPLRGPGGAASTVLLAADSGTAVLIASEQAGEAGPSVGASLALIGATPQEPLQLPAASGSGAWALACPFGAARLLAYGSTSQLRIVRLDASAPTPASQELTLIEDALRAPLDAEDATRDQVRLLCEGERAHLLYRNKADELKQVRCDAEGCGAPSTLVKDVAGFAALATRDDVIVAFAGLQQAAVVRVLTLDPSGAPRAAPITPAACWEPLGGMCGTPSLVRDEQRVILTARDGADLLALESTDHAHSFVTLSGFVAARSFEPSTTSPLHQHRVRKGLAD